MSSKKQIHIQSEAVRYSMMTQKQSNETIHLGVIYENYMLRSREIQRRSILEGGQKRIKKIAQQKLKLATPRKIFLAEGCRRSGPQKIYSQKEETSFIPKILLPPLAGLEFGKPTFRENGSNFDFIGTLEFLLSPRLPFILLFCLTA